MPGDQRLPGEDSDGRGPTLIVEADGASRGNPGAAAYGAVLRDAATGAVLAETADILGVATNNVAEYRGLIAGLRLAKEHNPQAQVEVHMDSRLVVEQMSGNWKIKHPDMRPLAMEAAAVYPPDQVTYRWVPRDQNAAADRLANLALDKATRGDRGSGNHGRVLSAVAAIAPTARTTVPDRPTPATGGPGRGTSSAAAPARAPAGVGRSGQEVLRGWAPADVGSPTTLVLLRHGETALTAQKRFSGIHEDVALSERGHQQAAEAAAALAQQGIIDAIVSSPLTRSRETASRVAASLGLPVEIDDDLRECDFGEWEGLTFAEVQGQWPDELTAWLASTEVAPPKGESIADVTARVRRARDRVLRQHPARTVLVVSHVTPIKQLVCLALNVEPAAVFRMELAPASISVVLWFADGNASLRLFNDTSHLRPAGT
ncbi:MAG TPA: bifunctional RNase H/acid phosphatase [Actinomycetes bacterium]|jgi:probable phosphoglycerate mutase